MYTKSRVRQERIGKLFIGPIGGFSKAWRLQDFSLDAKTLVCEKRKRVFAFRNKTGGG